MWVLWGWGEPPCEIRWDWLKSNGLQCNLGQITSPLTDFGSSLQDEDNKTHLIRLFWEVNEVTCVKASCNLQSGGKSWLSSGQSGTYIKMLHTHRGWLYSSYLVLECAFYLKTLSVLASFSGLLLIFHYMASEGTVKESSMEDMFLAE